MNTERPYHALMRAKVIGALEEAKQAATITHKGLKGRMREVIVSELLRPLLPSDVGIGSGQITDHKGCLSHQHDVILFDRGMLPPISFDQSASLIPLEAVLYTIEVKSVLTTRALASAHQSAQQLRTLSCLQPFVMQDGSEVTLGSWRTPVSVLFALRSSISEPIATYKEIYGKGHPCLGAICVPSLGYWYESNGSWVCFRGAREGDDVLGFVSGIINTAQGMRAMPGRHKIGHYLMDPSEAVTFSPSGTKPTLVGSCVKCAAIAILSFDGPAEEQLQLDDELTFPHRACSCGGAFTARKGRYQLINGRYELQ